jgi:alpha-ribazole phosphatase
VVTSLYLVRHPPPDVAPGVCYGQLDVGIEGRAEAHASAVRLHLPGDYTLVTSPLARARVLAEQLGVPRVDPRLREMSFGEWEGRAFDAIGRAIDDWAQDPFGFRPPGGETAREMMSRAREALDELLHSPPSPAVVLVGHAGPMRAMVGHLLGLPEERTLSLRFEAARVTAVEIGTHGASLLFMNR